MPNTRQAAKRVRQNGKRQLRNRMVQNKTRSKVTTAIAQIDKATDAASIDAALKLAFKALDKAASKGVIPKERASRKMSRIARLIKAKSSKPAASAQASSKK